MRLDANKYVIDRVLGAVSTTPSSPGILESFLKEIEQVANGEEKHEKSDG